MSILEGINFIIYAETLKDFLSLSTIFLLLKTDAFLFAADGYL